MAIGLYNGNIYGLYTEAEIYVAQGVVMYWNFYCWNFLHCPTKNENIHKRKKHKTKLFIAIEITHQ